MKKIILSLAAIALMCMVSCQKDDRGYDIFKASIEDNGKVLLGGDNSVQWQAGDQIKVYNTAKASVFTASNISTDGLTCDFILSSGGKIYGDIISAYYPATCFSHGDVVLPPMQEYDATNPIANVPMYAKTTDNTLHFKNLCSLLKLTLQKTDTVVKRISVTTDKGIWGTFHIDSSSSNYCIMADATSNNKTVMLTCGSGVDITNATDFYIYLPCGTYSTFEVKVYTSHDCCCTITPTASSVTAARNTIHQVSRNSMTFVAPAKFSVSYNTKVTFSEGNLQYQPSSNTFVFAANQYDVIGSANENVSSSYTGMLDLFGYATSGYLGDATHRPTNYRPWSWEPTDANYLQADMTGDLAHFDWGVHNAISGYPAGEWRTLTANEWKYLLTTRSGNRYAGVYVNSVQGILIYPDSYTWPSSITAPQKTNEIPDKNWPSYTTNQWNTLKAAGFVFLPYAGYRETTVKNNKPGDQGTTITISYTGSSFYYRTATSASYVYINGKNLTVVGAAKPGETSSYEARGMAVRLVHTVQ